MNTQTNRAPLALALAALIATAFAPISGADTSQPLYTFHHGAAGDPRWTVLKLEVPEGGATITATMAPEHYRCPSVWGLYFLTGTPEDAHDITSATIDTAWGQGGYVIHTGSTIPIQMNESNMSQDGHDGCYAITFIYQFTLPAGTVYALDLNAGESIQGRAELTSSVPIGILGISRGSESAYVNSTDFQGGDHIAAYSPHMWAGSNCDPFCEWSGGSWGIADFGMDRSTSIEFRYHPWFGFDSWGHRAALGEQASVNRVWMTDPSGHVTSDHHWIVPAPDGYSVWGDGIQTWDTSYSSGRYDFTIGLSAQASVTNSVAWHVWAIDLEFPEEQAARAG